MSVYAVSVFGESFPHSTQMRCVPSSGISLGDGGGSDGRFELTILRAGDELRPLTIAERRLGLPTLLGGTELMRSGASDGRFESRLLPGVFELPPVMIR